LIPMPTTPKLLGAIAILSVLLGLSIAQNLRQWSDARADDAADKAALDLAFANGKAAVLERNATNARDLAAEAERQRAALAAEQEAFVAEQRRREADYRRRMADIQLACAPGAPFVDAFNDALNN